MIVGYVFGIILIPNYVLQMVALKLSGFLGIILVLAIVMVSDSIMVSLPEMPDLPLVILLVSLLGLANALCWLAIWPLALEGVKGYTKIGGALLVMGIIDGAIFPLMYWSLGRCYQRCKHS